MRRCNTGDVAKRQPVFEGYRTALHLSNMQRMSPIRNDLRIVVNRPISCPSVRRTRFGTLTATVATVFHPNRGAAYSPVAGA